MGLEASTIGNIGTGLQTVGVVGQTIGAYRKSQGDQIAYEYQSKIAANNAQMAEWQAHDALLRGQVAENNTRQKTAQLAGSQRATMAARGLDLGEGSPLSILADTTFMGERDAATVHDNAAKESWALRTQAANYQSNASALHNRAEAESPFAAASSTLITGAGTVAAGWYARNKTKPYAAPDAWDS